MAASISPIGPPPDVGIELAEFKAIISLAKNLILVLGLADAQCSIPAKPAMAGPTVTLTLGARQDKTK